MRIATIGVVGAGTIGRGVAHAVAQHGYTVKLVDVEEKQLVSARNEIATNVRLQSLFVQSSGSTDALDVLSRIEFTRDFAVLSGVEYVVENVTESWDVKRAVYEELDDIVSPGTILAVNTSAIPITRVASVTSHPALVVGVHFMNPVHLMPLVEVIRGHFTSAETLAVTAGLLTSLGKEGIVVEDMPGFITNRVLMLTINEAIFCVQDRVASATGVDRIFKGCFGHKMGPLETADLIGLDTILNSITVMYEAFGDAKYRPAPLLRRMVDAGLLGRKAGRGFYDYRLTTSDNEERAE